jgi:hypothetical protein
MTTPLAEAIAKAGVLDEGMVHELIKWKAPVDLPEEVPLAKDPLVAVTQIQEAIESEEQVISRHTELDMLKHFLETKKSGKLHVVTEHDSADLEASFGRVQTKKKDGPAKLGDYIIPWMSESIEDVMTNGETFLLDGRRKIYFEEVRECFFGETKVFIICTPVVKDKPDGE